MFIALHSVLQQTKTTPISKGKKKWTQHKITRIEYSFFSLYSSFVRCSQCLQLLEPQDVKMFTCLCDMHLQFKRPLMFRFVLLFFERKREKEMETIILLNMWIDGHNNWFTCKSQYAHPKKWFTHARSWQKQLQKLKTKMIFFFKEKEEKNSNKWCYIETKSKQHQDF